MSGDQEPAQEPAQPVPGEPSDTQHSDSDSVTPPTAASPGSPDEAPRPSEPEPESLSEPVVGEVKAEPEPVEPSEPAVAASEPVEPSEPAVVVSEPVEPSGTPEPVTTAPPPSSPPAAPPPSGQAPTPPGGPGRIVEGVVTDVSEDSVDLRLDDGRPAVITRRNFGLNNEKPSEVLSVGDRAFGAELAREDPKQRVVLSRVWALKRQAWDKLAEQADSGDVITCRVTSVSKKGVVVDAGVRGFVPASHLALETVRDMSEYVGQTLELKILEIDPRKEKLVLSRRSLLQRQQRKERQDFLSSLQPGELRSGKVQSLAEYGAFVDLGGATGLVHLSELSWYRVRRPADVVSVGDDVQVKVLDVKVSKRRIALSMRQVQPDPLLQIESGTVHEGKVTRLVDFGAFVLIDGFEGLVHLSELAEYRVSTPEAVVAPGDSVYVKVLSVDPNRRRLELSIRRAAEFNG